MWLKEDFIEKAMRKTGWAYSDMRWLSVSQADRENKWRMKKVAWLRNCVSSSFNNNKLHIGPLSPGCIRCADGDWSCIFITHRCPAKCYFCQKSSVLEEPSEPYVDNVSFSSFDDYARFLELFKYRGMSVSGGDALCDFVGLINCVSATKKRFGNKIYLWAYTSGRELNVRKLKKLRDAGLNELRFNIAGINYNTSQLKMAVDWIETVTVEIPIIPEDFRRITSLLPVLEDIGVKHLNLHELQTDEANYRALVRRGYTFLHTPTIDVLESGNAALKILEFAVKNKITLPINYCSSAYKIRFQEKGRLRRLAPYVAHGYEDITEKGYIRRISIVDPARLHVPLNSIRSSNISKKRWYVDRQQKELVIHPSIIDKVKLPRKRHCVRIEYYQPQFSNIRTPLSEYEIGISSRKRVFVNRTFEVGSRLLCHAELNCFKAFFIDKRPTDEAFARCSKFGISYEDALAMKAFFEQLEAIPGSYDEIC